MVAASGEGGFTSLWAGGAVAAGLLLCTLIDVSRYDRMLIAENGGRELMGALLLGGAAMLFSLLYLFLELGFRDRNWSRGRVALIWGGVAVATFLWVPLVSLLSAANMLTTLLGAPAPGRWARGGVSMLASVGTVLGYWQFGLL